MTFHSSVIHSTLAKIKHLQAHDIVKATSGGMFIFYCILSVLLFVCLLMVCFCPSVLFSIFKYIVNNVIKLATWIFTYMCQVLHFISAAIITAYAARRQEENNIDNHTEDPIIRPFLPTSLSSNEQPFINQNEAEFCDPSTSI